MSAIESGSFNADAIRSHRAFSFPALHEHCFLKRNTESIIWLSCLLTVIIIFLCGAISISAKANVSSVNVAVFN